ncbi:MAG TPA: hypothetical protein ENG90_02875 [Gammaproteobacteria bacterium]|nr:hypothetical protein BMS3Abin11_01858 [bacterium BMS3Abin11]HDH15411.1 hypothetical protein [Gammaproteobacteria bacterium]
MPQHKHSTSLYFYSLIMRSQAALVRGDLSEMVNTLNATGAILQQATSRGAGARTALLIDSVIMARPNDGNCSFFTTYRQNITCPRCCEPFSTLFFQRMARTSQPRQNM